MRNFSNFCGIFATVFVTTTIILLASCSQDDDNYDSDMYTMAEMGTRLGGGDPGGGGPAPVITQVDSITETHEMYFFPNEVFYSSGFQHSPFTAIDPSLYSNDFIEADVIVTLKRVNNQPTVTSFIYSPSVISYGSYMNSTFTVTNVYLQPDGTPIPGRYLLYATGICTTYWGEYINFTAFIPNRIYM